MKNTVLILISILMFVFGILAFISSSADFAAEKLFFRAMRANSKIPTSSDTEQAKLEAYVEANLKRLLAKYPGSSLRQNAHLELAGFYLNNEKYVPALNTLFDIIKEYSQDEVILTRAHFMRGKVFEELGQWDKALREYNILRDQYSDSPLSLGIPLYVAGYYQSNEQHSQAEQAFNEAILFYIKLERENRAGARGYAAANLLVRAYMELEEYEKAGSVVEEIIDNYPKLLIFSQQLANIDLIFLNILNKPEKAVQLYKKVKVKTKDEGLIGALNDKIEAFEAQK